MKKTFTSLAALMLMGVAAQAQDFTVPEPTLTVPLGGKAELLYNMFQVTWGYYELVDNAGENPITCTLTKPDGTVMTVKGTITDANMEGTQSGQAPSTTENALSFRNFMELDQSSMQLVQEYGTYKVDIPEGMVLVNGVPNPQANLEFTITGVQEVAYMPLAQLVYPESPYTSYVSAIQINWPDQEIFFVDDVDSVDLEADLDGVPVACSASIKTVEGGNEDGTGAFTLDVLYITFEDFLSYTDGTYLTVMIPEGIVANAEDEVNASQTFEIDLFPQVNANVLPADNSELDVENALVNISWEGESLQLLKGSKVVARNVESGEDILVDVQLGEDASISMDLSKLEPGKYEIIVPESFVLILTETGVIMDSYAINSEIVVTYTLTDKESGVQSLNSDNASLKIYSIDGKNVNNTSALRKGIYIINGKKTMVK